MSKNDRNPKNNLAELWIIVAIATSVVVVLSYFLIELEETVIVETKPLYSVYRCEKNKNACEMGTAVFTKEDCKRFLKVAKIAQPHVERICIVRNKYE